MCYLFKQKRGYNIKAINEEYFSLSVTFYFQWLVKDVSSCFFSLTKKGKEKIRKKKRKTFILIFSRFEDATINSSDKFWHLMVLTPIENL